MDSTDSTPAAATTISLEGIVQCHKQMLIQLSGEVAALTQALAQHILLPESPPPMASSQVPGRTQGPCPTDTSTTPGEQTVREGTMDKQREQTGTRSSPAVHSLPQPNHLMLSACLRTFHPCLVESWVSQCGLSWTKNPWEEEYVCWCFL
ncbi:uncharacterized protein LOC143414992 isoform X4 [Maylandia zebra]|uniref:uncharacterized protein LOC143414992 isoform X4 n=1 Tax=Maylandia zebra TaxID=106582 RepID=UPI00403D54FE